MSDLVANAADTAAVKITIEVAGLTEVWEQPATESALGSALTAIEAVAAELRSRFAMAQELERSYGEPRTQNTDPK